MKALTFNGLKDVRCETVADARLADPADALVRVERAAICGSDMHVWHGRETGLDAGTIMGHELVGVVVETGAGVRELTSGDRVLCPFTTSCGACFYCKAGLTARCDRGQLFGWVEGGVGLHGAQAELVRVPLADTTLVKLPDGVSADEGLLLGDVMSTGYYCARMAGVDSAGVHVVVGCGPVGLMAVMGAKILGAERVFALDADPGRLARAAGMGAEPVNIDSEDAVQVLRAATGGRGADSVMEAVGSPAAARSAFDLVRPGGTVASVGVHTAPNFPFSPVEAYDKNVTFRIGRCPARAVLDELIPIVQEGRFDPASIITHRVPLAMGPDAYELFDGRRDGCVKIVLEP